MFDLSVMQIGFKQMSIIMNAVMWMCVAWLSSAYAVWCQIYYPTQYWLMCTTIATIVYISMVYCLRKFIHQVPRQNDCNICLESIIGSDFVWCFFCKNRFHIQCCDELYNHANKCPLCRKSLFMVSNNIKFLSLRIHSISFVSCLLPICFVPHIFLFTIPLALLITS
jgi:hypothetical protein